jgi:hypothetical protein
MGHLKDADHPVQTGRRSEECLTLSQLRTGQRNSAEFKQVRPKPLNFRQNRCIIGRLGVECVAPEYFDALFPRSRLERIRDANSACAAAVQDVRAPNVVFC